MIQRYGSIKQVHFVTASDGNICNEVGSSKVNMFLGTGSNLSVMSKLMRLLIL